MTTDSNKRKAEELTHEDPEVRRALEQTAGPKPPKHRKVEAKHKVWVGTYLGGLVALGVLYYFVRHDSFRIFGDYQPLAERLVTGLMAVLLLLVIRTAIRGFLIEPLEDAAARYNLNRIVNLVAYLAIFFIVL